MGEFEKHGWQANRIIEYVQSINGLQREVQQWIAEVASVRKSRDEEENALKTIFDATAKKRATLEELQTIETQTVTRLAVIQQEYDHYYLQIGLARTFVQLLTNPSKTTDGQINHLVQQLLLIPKSRDTAKGFPSTSTCLNRISAS